MKKQSVSVDDFLQQHAEKKAIEVHRHSAKQLAEEVTRLRGLLDVQAALKASRKTPIHIAQRERGAAKEGTAVLLFSDIHPEEVVGLENTSGMNEFSPEIATERVKKLVIGFRWMLETVRASEGRAGYRIRSVILGLLGDLISNSIHADLAESNALGPAEAALLAFDLIRMVVDAILEDGTIEELVIPCLHGNHDRGTFEIRHQTKYETSLSTILYGFLARHYAKEPRVKLDIAHGNMVYIDVYGKLIRFTHGDDIRFGGGVGGITIPVRKAIDAWNDSHHATLTCMGHWHQVTDNRDFVVNGSVIGYTAYSQAIKARFEPAAQAFFVLDKTRGKRLFSPIQLQDSEKWS